MKPAVSSKKRAVILGVLVGTFAFYWYFEPFPWLGAIMGLLAGLFTFYILSARRMERFRRVYFILLFALTLTTLIAVIVSMGTDTFLNWVKVHEKEYYLPGQSLGTLLFPCARVVPQVLLGRAVFLAGAGLWQTNFPSSLELFLLTLVPFVLTGLLFGRGFCGWICPFGGLTEAMVTGKKERWSLNIFKRQAITKKGVRFEGLKEWVKDTKYGILLGIILLSIFFAFPLVCIFCPVLWLESLVIFSVIVAIIFIFAVVLPFMTKRRWFCVFICPVGTVFSLLNKISLFRIRIDKSKCIKCNDCVQECRMYALAPKVIEEFKSPNEDCIRCGRCIEVCSEEAMDIYLAGTSIKVRSWFISLAIVAALAWYAWFIILLADML